MGWCCCRAANRARRTPCPLISGDQRHRLPGHQRLACQACHSRWTPQCYGCHDYRQNSGSMWSYAARKATPRRLARKPRPVPLQRPGAGGGLPRQGAALCARLPGGLHRPGQHTGTPLPGHGLEQPKPGTIKNSIVTTPISPHTTRTEVRPCEACHLGGKALGLGGGPRPPGQAHRHPLGRPSGSGLPG